jgi:AcrR family transcriptional regulator
MRTLDPLAHASVRRRILDAARDLFADQGYHACSMAQVAERAKLGKAGLYHYFKSKQAILEALHDDLWADTESRIAAMPRCHSLKEVLRYAGRGYLQHFEDPKAVQMTRIVFNMGRQDSGLRQKAVALVKPDMEKHILALFGPWFEPGTPPGQVNLFAMQFFGSLFYQVFVLRHLCPGGELPVTPFEYLEQLVETFAAGARRIGGR